MGVNKIGNTLDFAQSKPDKQTYPLMHSSKIPHIQDIDNGDYSRDLLKELGISIQQFRILFDNLPQCVALYKMIFDKDGTPVDFIRLESNKAYGDIHSFKRQRIGK